MPKQLTGKTGLPLGSMIASTGISFLAADQVVKMLPPTPAWALGWGAVATVGTFMLGRTVFGPEVGAAAALGVAAAYVHGFGHQTPYPHRT